MDHNDAIRLFAKTLHNRMDSTGGSLPVGE
jgi:hypothetical protein